MADGPQQQPRRQWDQVVFFQPVAVRGKHFSVSNERDVSAT